MNAETGERSRSRTGKRRKQKEAYDAAKERRLKYLRQLEVMREGTDAHARAKGFKDEADRCTRMKQAEEHILKRSPAAVAAVSRGTSTTPDGAVRVLTAAGAENLRQREQQPTSKPAPTIAEISEQPTG